MAELSDLAILDGNNTARFPQGQTVPSLNDGARALEGILGRWRADNDLSLATAGTSTAYTLTSNRSITSYSSAIGTFLVRAHLPNGGASTININGIGDKPLVRQNGDALVAGDISQHQPLHLVYNPATDSVHCIGILA